MTSLLPVTCLTVQSTVSILSLMQRCAAVVPELSISCMAVLCSVCFQPSFGFLRGSSVLFSVSLITFFLDLSH